MHTITDCKIEPLKYTNVIWVIVDSKEIICIGRYYPDELHFEESEFIGLTLAEAKQLVHERDVAYLRS